MTPRKHFFLWLVLGWVLVGIGCTTSNAIAPTLISSPPTQPIVGSETAATIKITKVALTPEESDLTIQFNTATPTIFPTMKQITPTPPITTPTINPTTAISSKFRLGADTDFTFQGQLVAIEVENHENGERGVVIIDTVTAKYRYLWVQPPDIFVQGFNWAVDGRGIVNLTLRPDVKYVDTIDLNGDLISRDEFNVPEEDEDKTITDLLPSPSGKWVAYIVHDGDMGMFFSDIQDVHAISVEGNNQAHVMLSQGAWNLEPNWSSDGRYLAYVDLDENGDTQLFTFDTKEGTKTQLSNLSNIIKIETVKWSPNGDFLAFSAIDSDSNLSLWSIPTNGGEELKANLNVLESGDILGWINDGDGYVALVESENFDNTQSNGEVVWIEASTGVIVNHYSLVMDQVPLGVILPIDENHLLLIAEDSIIQLDAISGDQEIVGESPLKYPIQGLVDFPRVIIGPP